MISFILIFLKARGESDAPSFIPSYATVSQFWRKLICLKYKYLKYNTYLKIYQHINYLIIHIYRQYFNIDMKSKTRSSSTKLQNVKFVQAYQIQQIIKHKILYGQLYYEVKWKGYQNTTLEPLENLSQVTDLIDNYKLNKLTQYLTKDTSRLKQMIYLSEHLSNFQSKMAKVKKQQEMSEQINVFNVKKKLRQIRDKIAMKQNKDNIQNGKDKQVRSQLQTKKDRNKIHQQVQKTQSAQITQKIIKQIQKVPQTIILKQKSTQQSAHNIASPQIQSKPLITKDQQCHTKMIDQNNQFNSLNYPQTQLNINNNHNIDSSQFSSPFNLFKIDEQKIICDSESIQQNNSPQKSNHFKRQQNNITTQFHLFNPLKELFTNLITQNNLQLLRMKGCQLKIIKIQHHFSYNQIIYFKVAVQKFKNKHYKKIQHKSYQLNQQSYTDIIILDLTTINKYYREELHQYLKQLSSSSSSSFKLKQFNKRQQ